MAKNFSDLENVTTENAKGVKDILTLAIKGNKAFALAVEENDGIKLVFAGNPAFAVRAATTLLIKVVTPAARAKLVQKRTSLKHWQKWQELPKDLTSWFRDVMKKLMA